jgi:hypothetical protein
MQVRGETTMTWMFQSCTLSARPATSCRDWSTAASDARASASDLLALGDSLISVIC